MNNTFTAPEKLFSFFCKTQVAQQKNKIQNEITLEQIILKQNIEWTKYWDRYGISAPDFNDKVVVDYGCGFGYQSLFALRGGAKHVYCLEISDGRLKKAKELHISQGFNNVTYINNIDVNNLDKKIEKNSVDIIFSMDVMEHVPSPVDVLKSMFSIVNLSGEVYIGFSPLYKSPYGPHFRALCGIPWIHLIFSEKTILNVFKKLYNFSDDIQSYQDIEGSGVNKLSYYEYKKLINNFKWKKQIDLTNRYPERPGLMKIMQFITAIIPFNSLRELFLINSYIKLVKIK